MKTNRFFLKSFHPFYLIAFIIIIIFAGCQKDNLVKLSPEELNAAGTQASVSLERIILAVNFQMETEGMSDAQILHLYAEMTGYLSEADRNSLIACARTSLTQQYQNIPGLVISNRSTESVLTTGILNDNFGVSVATVGNKVYVGANLIQKVYEYAKTGGTYELNTEISPNSPWPGFGATVSVSGSWMAVGAPRTAALGGGKVFMYKKQGNAWVQKAILTGPAGNNSFGGRGTGLQGNTLIVTSNKSFPAPPRPYAVSTISVFTLSGNEWSLEQELVQPGMNHSAVKLDASENRIATCSGLYNLFSLPTSFVYVRNGTNWTLEDEVIINLPGVGAARDVAIDGNNMLLLPIFPGTLVLVITNNAGNWELSEQLVIPAGQQFRTIYGQIEGQRLIIGSSSGNNAIPDQVHVFENMGASWEMTETLIPADQGVNVIMNSIALEGNTSVMGCWGQGVLVAGKAYVFD